VVAADVGRGDDDDDDDDVADCAGLLLSTNKTFKQVSSKVPGSAAKTPSGETLNRWTWHGMTSVSRQWTEVGGKNGLLDVVCGKGE